MTTTTAPTTTTPTQAQVTAQIAKELVELCRKGQNLEAIERFYSPDIVSTEGCEMPGGMPRTMRGIESIRGKNKWWLDNHTIHASTVDACYTSVEKFAVAYSIDATFKPTGKRHKMSEVGVYTVTDGKISHEEFLYQGC